MSTEACTSTFTVHGLLARAAVEKVMLVAAAVAENAPQVLDVLGTVATATFAGSISVKLASMFGVLGFVMVMVSVVGLFTPTVVGLNDTVAVGGARLVRLK